MYHLYWQDYGTYLTFTIFRQYTDSDISAGSEYCYHVTAVYEEGQSIPSNTSCATAEGEPELPGDINGDSILNILDIVLVVNFILGSDTPSATEFAAADLNSDGILNILDVVTLTNSILGA